MAIEYSQTGRRPTLGLVGKAVNFALCVGLTFGAYATAAADASVSDMDCPKLWALGAVAVWPEDLEGPPASAPDGSTTPPRIQVEVVIDRLLDRIDRVKPVLVDAQNKSLPLVRYKGTDVYTGDPGPDRYVLEVTAKPDRLSPPQYVFVKEKPRRIRAYLGRKGDCFYRMGRSLIPFKARDDLLIVYFDFRPPTAAKSEQILENLIADKLPIAPFRGGSPKDLQFLRDEGALWLLELHKPSERDEVARKIRSIVEKETGNVARVGVPFAIRFGEIDETQLVAVDNYFVVQPRAGVTAGTFNEWLMSVKASTVRVLSKAKLRLLIRFETFNYRENLATIEQGFSKGVLQIGEPDLIFELVDEELPADWPNEARYWANQWSSTNGNHWYQNVRQAWAVVDALNQQNSQADGPNVGSSSIYLGTLDTGIKHSKDVDCEIASGTSLVYRAFDAVKLIDWDHTNYSIPNRHGLGVFGVAAACANNSADVAGVSPAVRHIAVKRPEVSATTRYRDTLLWMAGLGVICPDNAANNDPCWSDVLKPAADVINASHGAPYQMTEVPAEIAGAFDRITKCGRSEKGTGLVYAAGNEGYPIAQRQPLAAHDKVFAVANCRVVTATGNVKRVYWQIDGTSNFGVEVGVCALGHASPTIAAACPAGSTPCKFGGTSAATATVSSAITLMLAANPQLTWDQVRNLLKEHADRSRIVINLPNDPQDSNVWGVDPSWDANNRSIWFGSGLLDVGASVEAAKNTIVVPVTPDPECLNP